MLRYALAAAIVLSAGAASAQAPSPAVTEVLELNTRLEAAIASGDADRIAPFFAPEFRLQNSANAILTGDQVLAQFRSGAVRFTAYDRTVEAAYPSGDVVVLMGVEKVRPSGAAASGQTITRRFTSVWRKLPEGWRQIARQSTNVP